MFGFLFQRVYLQLFIVLAGGILLGSHYPLPAQLLITNYLLLLAVITCLGLLWWVWRDSESWLSALPGFAALFAVGFISVSISIELPLKSPLRGHVQYAPQVMFGEVRDMPRFRDGHLRFMLAVDEVRQPEAKPWEGQKTSGLCYVYLKAEAPPELYTGDRIRLFASLDEAEAPRCRGQFNYRAYLLGRGTVLTAYATSTKCLTRVSEGRPWFWAWLAELRAGLTERLARHMPPELGSLAVSVVYGDKITDLSDEMRERFRKAGLTHILVASGTQVSLLIVLLAFAFLRLRNDFTWRSVLLGILQFAVSLTIVLIYAAVTGFETSIVRALSMGVLIMAGRLFSRKADGMTTLTQSALVILLVNPLQLFAPGFLLSFGATFGLIYIAGVGFPLLEGLKSWRLWVSQTLITSGGAQLFVAPVLIASFNQLSLWGLFSNLLAIPLGFALLMVGGIASLGLVQLPLIGPLLGWLCSLLARALDSVATLFSLLPGANLSVPDPPVWWIVAFYALLLLIGEAIKLRGELSEAELRTLRLTVPLCALVLWASVLSWWLVPAAELSALNLPGAEVYLWRAGSGESVLLLREAGLARAHNGENVVSALRSRGINHLSGIVWLDGEPQTNPLEGYAAPVYAAGSAVPEAWDMQWEVGSKGRCYGACFSLGGRMLRVIWDRPAMSSPFPEGTQPEQVDCSILLEKNDAALRDDRLRELWQRGGKLYLLGDYAQQTNEFEELVGTELSFRPRGGGLRATAFKATPELR